MNLKLPILLLAVASLGTGCIVHTHARPGPVYAPADPNPPPPPPPPPPVAQPMSYPEAVQLSSNYAASRGFSSNVKEAHLEKNSTVWKVQLAVFRGEVRGHMKLEYDAYSRALLRADEKVKDHHGHGHKGDGRWDDEDDDDDVHGASAVGRPPPGQINNNGQVHGASPVAH